MEPALCLREVCCSFGLRPALVGVDLTVDRGSVHGLLGPNGAGKSTLLRVLLGLVRPQQGTVEILGRDVLADPRTALAPVAGFVEAPRFYPYLSARTNLEVLARLDGRGARRRVAPVLEQVGLADRAEDRVGGFSLGMRQRLGLASALLRDPEVLVLDEPGNGLDPAGKAELRELVRGLAASGRTVLLSSHDLDEVAELCASVTVLRAGAVAHHGPVAGLSAAGRPRSLTTSDDARALTLARDLPGLDVRPDGSGLSVVAEVLDDLDSYLLELAGQGVVVRSLAPEQPALLDAFLGLSPAQPVAGAGVR